MALTDQVRPNVNRAKERDPKGAYLHRLTVWIPHTLMVRGWLIPPQKLSSAGQQILVDLWNGQITPFALDPVSSKGSSFGPTLWKVRGRGLDLIGRGECRSQKGTNWNRGYVFIVPRMCVN